MVRGEAHTLDPRGGHPCGEAMMVAGALPLLGEAVCHEEGVGAIDAAGCGSTDPADADFVADAGAVDVGSVEVPKNC
jgi:hypothetical protein